MPFSVAQRKHSLCNRKQRRPGNEAIAGTMNCLIKWLQLSRTQM